MNVLGILWAGVRVSDADESLRFFTDILGLEVAFRDESQGFTLFHLPSGQQFELLGPNSRWHRVHEDPVVIGFQVDDVAATRLEMETRGVEFVSEIAGEPASGQWCYFRGPDGVLYEICALGTDER